jgi:large subunit ribosomal protein L51
MPMPKSAFRDNWSEKKAVFGQNDYIDILGNGNVSPVDLIRGPSWLVGMLSIVFMLNLSFFFKSFPT